MYGAVGNVDNVAEEEDQEMDPDLRLLGSVVHVDYHAIQGCKYYNSVPVQNELGVVLRVGNLVDTEVQLRHYRALLLGRTDEEGDLRNVVCEDDEHHVGCRMETLDITVFHLFHYSHKILAQILIQ